MLPTILSRCQRFDLRRVEPDVLARHLGNVASAEGALLEADGLALIARAAEGSVRDGLSLLDQAIVQADRGQVVGAAVVRDMLGLADRAQTIALFEAVMRGQAAEALQGFRVLYGFGADPAQVVGDLLEHAHAASVAKALGPDVLGLPGDQAARLAAIGAQASAGVLSRVWQMLLKAHEEVRRAPDPAAAVEMALIRLCYAADLPGPEEALKTIASGEPPVRLGAASSPPSGGERTSMRVGAAAPARPPQRQVQSQASLSQANLSQASLPQDSLPQPSRPQANLRPASDAVQQTMLQSFADVLGLIEARRDVTLKLDVEKYVRLIDFTPLSASRPGVITFEPAPGAPSNLPQRLSGRLKEWTGQRWMMDLQVGGQESALERERREEVEAKTRIEQDPFVLSVMDAFPGTEVVAIRKIAQPQASPVGSASDDEGSDGDDTP